MINEKEYAEEKADELREIIRRMIMPTSQNPDENRKKLKDFVYSIILRTKC